MNIDELTAEQIEKAKACETAEELRAFAESLGHSLSDEELDALAGGVCERFNDRLCPLRRNDGGYPGCSKLIL